MSTAPVLPVSLSPHVCILPSPDLVELLEQSSLPPLHQLFQAFSPLPQVTTRTSTLTTVTHTTFPLRFSDYRDVETTCREDENSRAERTIDWIGQRIGKRAQAWVEEAEKEDYTKGTAISPWWLELDRCIEGDRAPSRHEVILASSTVAPNPLQAVTELHAKYNEMHLPSWVDPSRLCHTIIIHPSNSPLNSDEAMALYNATKKQYGVHTHLLSVSLSPPDAPIAAPSLLPELPLSPLPNTSFTKRPETQELHLSEEDVSQFARFIREFTTMSLVPWMERSVMEWNESVSMALYPPVHTFNMSWNSIPLAAG
ncbi:hypothetical protein M422DRAFT_274866 [Sphaerobolus stellatus SS14]|uniref:Unplaced genomic scaffold SPHSTscaffold_422, whole genome shotgun sequence n=1 Tax=Sphaerobolus stellatus (strain SS14) TaxID=990650 RepID=A0A0C9UGN5_SPHS4|nr:hypothetical protein M422DRAFT_274866 [Sphaerobolus stellatus SS14]